MLGGQDDEQPVFGGTFGGTTVPIQLKVMAYTKVG